MSVPLAVDASGGGTGDALVPSVCVVEALAGGTGVPGVPVPAVDASGGGTGATLDPAGAVLPVASVGPWADEPLLFWASVAAGIARAAVMTITAGSFLIGLLLM